MKLITRLKVLSAISLVALLSLSFTESKVNEESDWTLLKTDSNVELYGQITNCDGSEIYLFKLKNNSDLNQTIEVVILAPNEPAYGPQTFVQTISAKSETTSVCAESELRLPKSVKDADILKVSIKLTSK